MAYEKLLNEIYAALSLKYLWGGYRPCFVKSESPDWVNDGMGLGLEVSQALLPADGQAEKFISTYLGYSREALPPDAETRYRGRLHFYNGRFWAILPDPRQRQDVLAKARFRFDRKLEKLNTNYQERPKNGLYLFLHPEGEDGVDAEALFRYIKEAQAWRARRFDWVFLNCVKVIYVCDFEADKVETILLPPNAAAFLDTEAERLRNLGVWENGRSLDEMPTENSLDRQPVPRYNTINR